MIKAWLGQLKFYLFGAVLFAAGAAYWYHGHVEFKAGKLAGDKKVAALKAQYATAYEQASSTARAIQAQADAHALAEANKRAAQSEWQLSIMTATAQTAQQRANDFEVRLKEARKHDTATAAWLDDRIPDGVRAAGQSSSR